MSIWIRNFAQYTLIKKQDGQMVQGRTPISLKQKYPNDERTDFLKTFCMKPSVVMVVRSVERQGCKKCCLYHTQL